MDRDLESRAADLREEITDTLYECYRISEEHQFRVFLEDLRFLRRLAADYREELLNLAVYSPDEEGFTGEDLILGDKYYG